MGKGRNNILVGLVLLIFSGQAVASSIVFCPMMNPFDNSMMNHESSTKGIDHSAHVMTGKQNPNSHSEHSGESTHLMKVDKTLMSMDMPEDCCAADGNCSMAGCAVSFVSYASLLFGLAIDNSAVDSERFLSLRHSPNSLYKPPIIA